MPSLSADAPPPAPTALTLPETKVHEKVLANGMQWLVVEDHTAPVFSAVIRFRVGGVDERPGLTGTSHLLEHMLFKGTKRTGTTDYAAEKSILDAIDAAAAELVAEQRKLQNPLAQGSEARVSELREKIAKLQADQKKYVIKDELWDTYVRHGGTGLNASTTQDGTQYFVSLPVNKLPLWAYFESDRLTGTILREFYSERDVVYEERRLRTETSPNGKLWEALQVNAFIAHPYGAPVVGFAGDLKTVTRESVDAYYRMMYAPNNAICAVVGDVEPQAVFALAQKYFAPLARSTPPPPVFTDEPEQEGERRAEVEYDAKPQFMAGFHTPGVAHADLAPLKVLASVLSAGRTSRYYVAIEEKKLGLSAGAFVDEGRYPSLFVLSGAPVAPHTTAELESAMYDEVARVAREGVSDWELARTKNQARANYLRGQRRPMTVAYQLTDAAAVAGDFRYARTSVERVLAVTADDVKRVAGAYFKKSNRTVVTLLPTAGAKPKDPIRLKPGSLHHGGGEDR